MRNLSNSLLIDTSIVLVFELRSQQILAASNRVKIFVSKIYVCMNMYLGPKNIMGPDT